jgi:RNA polymerase sigma factor (sigma-70 family)
MMLGEDRQNAALHARLDARFRGPLMSFFLRRVTNRAEAEDLTQEVFARLLAATDRAAIDDADSFVFQIAANLLRDRGRQTATRAATQLVNVDQRLVSELTREFLEDREPERALIGRETIVSVLKALDELGQRTRDIYLLARLEGMKHRDIGALYDVSVGTVEKAVARANLHLALRFGSSKR